MTDLEHHQHTPAHVKIDWQGAMQELAEEVQDLLQGASLYLVGMMGRCGQTLLQPVSVQWCMMHKHWHSGTEQHRASGMPCSRCAVCVQAVC